MPFLEEEITAEISYGSGFGAEFVVEIHETLKNRYAVAKHPYKVASFSIQLGNNTLQEQVDRLFDIFDRCGGLAGGFLVRNRADCSTNHYIGVPTYQDQLCQEINAVAKTYQIMEWFGTPSSTCRRRIIKKPVAGTLLVSIKSGSSYTPTAAYTVNTATGIITLTNALGPGETLYAGCYFNTPVMFLTDLKNISWQTRTAGNEYILSSSVDLVEVLSPENIA